MLNIHKYCQILVPIEIVRPGKQEYWKWHFPFRWDISRISIWGSLGSLLEKSHYFLVQPDFQDIVRVSKFFPDVIKNQSTCLHVFSKLNEPRISPKGGPMLRCQNHLSWLLSIWGVLSFTAIVPLFFIRCHTGHTILLLSRFFPCCIQLIQWRIFRKNSQQQIVACNVLFGLIALSDFALWRINPLRIKPILTINPSWLQQTCKLHR